MAYGYRKQTQEQQTTSVQEKEQNQFFMNLEFHLPNGMTVPLNSNNTLTLSLDAYLKETKNVSTDSDWAKQQLIRNAFIGALNEVCQQMDEGEVVTFAQLLEHPVLSKLLPLMGFSLKRRGETKLSEGAVPSSQQLNELLGL